MLPQYQQRHLYNNMADVNKSKLQLRSGLSVNGDKTPSPSPATKLLINHGKPNFTIQRSLKTQNGNVSPPTQTTACKVENNNNDFVVRSTTFNGVFKPSTISPATKQTLSFNGNTINKNGNGDDNEAAKVVLRRAKIVQPEIRGAEDDANVPEFIRRQRRIQERLANQNILDFENRRSGYFTQVLISPSSPNRQSFVETMASPAVKPGLEMPPPPTQPEEIIKDETTLKKQEVEPQQQQPEDENIQENRNTETVVSNGQVESEQENVNAEPVTLIGQIEEEEVAKAIEEVNKAVEGEDDDKTELEDQEPVDAQNEEEIAPKNAETQQQETAHLENACEEEISTEAPVAEITKENTLQENGEVSVVEHKVEEAKTNGCDKNPHPEEDLLSANKLDSEVTISHANGINGPSIPAPDPKGEKGVNFEPKTLVSFSQELGNGDNKYPDTVKVVQDIATSEADSELKELTKLKFEIKGDDQDIEVKPVLISETA